MAERTLVTGGELTSTDLSGRDLCALLSAEPEVPRVFTGCDFSGADLRGADLGELDLADAARSGHLDVPGGGASRVGRGQGRPASESEL